MPRADIMDHFTPSEAPIHSVERLPVKSPSKMVGRNAELGQVFAQVRAGAPVLLHGAGGVGKSALAATIAAAFTTFPGGVLWWQVDNDPLEQLIARLGRAYRDHTISDSPAPLDHLDAARGLLERENKPLLVLDGVLDLNTMREFMRKIAPNIPVILTNENGGPGPWMPVHLDLLDEESAIELFIHLAGYDHITNVVRADIHGVYQALAGSALAITLAARRARVTQEMPGEFLGTLTSPGAKAEYLPGLNSIFQALPDALRGMLLFLGATFSGRATADLLERISLSPLETVNHVMGMLVARGIAQSLPPRGNITTYTLHEVIHGYLQNWLEHNGRLEATTTSVIDAVVDYAEAHSLEDREAREGLIAEMPNIISTARHAAQHGKADVAQRLAAAFGDGSGYGYEARLLKGLVETPAAPYTAGRSEAEQRSFTDLSPAMSFLDELVNFESDLPDEAAADLETAPPEAEQPSFADLSADISFLDELVNFESDLSEESADPELEVVATTPPGADLLVFADAPLDEPASLEFDEEFEEEYPEEPDLEINGVLAIGEAAIEARKPEKAVASLNTAGQMLLNQNRIDEAQEVFEQSLAICEEFDNLPGMLFALEGLAGISLDNDDLENAVVFATRAENLAAEGDDLARHGQLLMLLGDVRLELGHLDEAVETYHSAIEVFKMSDDALGLGLAYAKLGNAYLDRGNLTQTITMLSEAQMIFERDGHVEYQMRVSGNIGTAYGQLGEWDEAEARHQQALAIARPLGDIEEQERQLANLAHIAQIRGDRPALINRYRQALALAYSVEEPAWQIRYLDALGRLLMNDLTQIGIAVVLLEEANNLMPNDERARLLNRARTRMERAESSVTVQVILLEGIAEWANAVFTDAD